MTTQRKYERKDRVEVLREMDIEFIDSESFRLPDAESIILGPAPKNKRTSPSPKPPSGTPPFLAALYEFPLLSPEQEHHLFRKMNFLKFQAEELRKQWNPVRVTSAATRRFEQLLAESLAIRNHIVQSNLRLVVSIAKKLIDGANSFDELVSEGIPPLIRAVEIFDFDRGTRFSTYATWAVRNCLHRASPRNRKLRTRFRTSADAVFAGAAENRSSVTEDVAYHRRLRETVRQGLKKLDARDRKIVKARFALDGSDRPRRFREIAEELNLSTERVRQLLARSLGRLQENVCPDALAVI